MRNELLSAYKAAIETKDHDVIKYFQRTRDRIGPQIVIDECCKVDILSAENQQLTAQLNGHKAVTEVLTQTADQLRAEILELENNQACDVCSPDDYGWQHNAVEGRVPCSCITESGAYQVLEEERDQLRAKVREAFISGYEAGHNDTVESCYGCPEGKADDYDWGGR